MVRDGVNLERELPPREIQGSALDLCGFWAIALGAWGVLGLSVWFLGSQFPTSQLLLTAVPTETAQNRLLKSKNLVLQSFLPGAPYALQKVNFFGSDRPQIPTHPRSMQMLGPENFVFDLETYGRLLSVALFAPDFVGSGVLIAHETTPTGHTYTLFTNAHVIRGTQPPYQIQTGDGQVHRGRVLWREDPNGADLAVLQFTIAADPPSPPPYPTARLQSGSPLPMGNAVLAVGWVAVADVVEAGAEVSSEIPAGTASPDQPVTAATPLNPPLETTQFYVLPGTITHDLAKPLERGYQRGYSSPVEKGMSGGPLLDGVTGVLLGLNGVHADPLWEVYTYFEDGTDPPATLQQAIPESSWAIPSDRFLPLALSFGAQVTQLAHPSNSSNPESEDLPPTP